MSAIIAVLALGSPLVLMVLVAAIDKRWPFLDRIDRRFFR